MSTELLRIHRDGRKPQPYHWRTRCTIIIWSQGFEVKQINNFNLNEFFETHEASEYPFIRFVIEVKQPSTILSQIVMTRARDSWKICKLRRCSSWDVEMVQTISQGSPESTFRLSIDNYFPGFSVFLNKMQFI